MAGSTAGDPHRIDRTHEAGRLRVATVWVKSALIALHPWCVRVSSAPVAHILHQMWQVQIRKCADQGEYAN